METYNKNYVKLFKKEEYGKNFFRIKRRDF